MTKAETLELAVVQGVIAIQGLTIEDGTTLVVEVDQPQLVFAVVRRVGAEISVVSIHANEAEADARKIREAGGASTLQ